LKVEENYVGCGAYICLTFEYDANAIIPFLMIVFEMLNLIVQACIIRFVGSILKFGDFMKEDNNIFGVNASIEESSCALVVGELSLFKRLFITPTTCADPLTWRQIHESQILGFCQTNIGNPKITI
jgi:hypothetical protein